MTDDLDTILSSDEVVTPSPGFTSAVMRAVHQSLSSAGMIRFPWFRFAAGLVGGFICLFFSLDILFSKELPDLRFIDITPWAIAMNQAWMINVLYATFILMGSLLVVRISIEFFSD